MRLYHDRASLFFSRVDRADPSACRKSLSPDELEKAGAFRFEKDRQLSIQARAQIRFLISEVTGVPAAALRFSREEGGKPRIRPGTPGEEVLFSLSHTRGMVISALGLDAALGVDMEVLDRKVDPDIARRFFAPAETRQIMARSGPEQAELFLRFWTLKEAWAKAEGRGLAAGLDRMAFDLSRSGRIRWNGPEGMHPGWQFFQFSPVPGAVAALAAASARPLTLEIYDCIPFGSVRPLELEITSSAPPHHRGNPTAEQRRRDEAH